MLLACNGKIKDYDKREYERIRQLVERLGINPAQIELKFLPNDQGPGNTILVSFSSNGRTEIFTGYGERGKRAERVAMEVAREAKNFSRSAAQFDPHLVELFLSLDLEKYLQEIHAPAKTVFPHGLGTRDETIGPWEAAPAAKDEASECNR